VTANKEAKPSKYTTTFNFIKPPFRFVFGAGRQNSGAAARFAERLRQKSSNPLGFYIFFLAHTDALKGGEVT
jgi:hypothetical protein